MDGIEILKQVRDENNHDARYWQAVAEKLAEVAYVRGECTYCPINNTCLANLELCRGLTLAYARAEVDKELKEGEEGVE